MELFSLFFVLNFVLFAGDRVEIKARVDFSENCDPTFVCDITLKFIPCAIW